SAYAVASLVPSTLPPTKIVYLSADRPTNARSAVYGRAQPLGQPVIRTVSRRSASPRRSSSPSSSSITPGSTRSDSASARPHVADPHGGRRRQCAAQPLLHLRAEPVEAPIVQQILEARVPAVAAVAVVALHRQHRLGDLDHVFRCGKPQRIGESRVGDLLAVGHPQPPTDQHVESGNAVP